MTQTKDEALKLALDALENHEGNYKLGDAGCDRLDKAITAIKAALAAQPEQEPVAWALQEEDGQIYDCICNDEHDRHEGRYTVPLYTTPQQRPWVGLTEAQIFNEVISELSDEPDFAQGFVQGARWAEAKLKENT
jgi:hypothetical protein